MSQEAWVKKFEEWGPATSSFTANVIKGNSPETTDYEGRNNDNGCHYRMGYVANDRSKYFGQFLSLHRTERYAKAYLKWLVGPNSPYKPLLDHVGDRFQPVYNPANKDDMIAWTMYDVLRDTNFRMIHNFFKSVRLFQQYHTRNGLFFDDWAFKRKKNPVMAMILGSYIAPKARVNDKHYNTWRNGEAYVTPGKVTSIDMRCLMSNTHGLWDPSDTSNPSYRGEEKYMWASKDSKFSFNPYKDLKTIKNEVEGTRFVKIYEKKEVTSYEESLLEKFFNNHPYQNKKGVTCVD